tara:strand:- start:1769 stop:2320 length:552 start_codon:yes stop_codon:yes gene_type:complete
MAASITSTIGGASSNSYLTVSTAQDKADERLGTLAWTTATTDQKTRALITAAGYLDQLSWIGDRASTTQSMAWPRNGVSCGEKVYTNLVIPPEVLEGQFDIAELLLGTPGAINASSSVVGELVPGIPNSSLRRAKLAVLELEFLPGGAPARKNVLTVLPYLQDLFGCLCLSVGSSSTMRIKRA